MNKKTNKYNGAAELYNSGVSVVEVGRIYGVTRQAVWEALKIRGVVFRARVRLGENNVFFRGGSKSNRQAHHKVEQAIKRGVISRGLTCEICGSPNKVEAHHDDYSKPLQVRWLCKRHHYEWHQLNEARH